MLNDKEFKVVLEILDQKQKSLIQLLNNSQANETQKQLIVQLRTAILKLKKQSQLQIKESNLALSNKNLAFYQHYTTNDRPQNTPGNRKILIIDDDIISREIVKEIVLGFGIKEVVVVNDGQSGLSTLKNNEIFDAILCDWEMPNLSGLELLRLLRLDPKFKKQYFVMVTGHGEKEAIKIALESEVDDYLVKPISEEILLNKITAVCPELKKNSNNSSLNHC